MNRLYTLKQHIIEDIEKLPDEKHKGRKGGMMEER